VTQRPGSPTAIRKIIHCDCDCFYAAVEMRDDPSLRGRPLAVGGSADRRGVVATCNYEARAFGVRSAMASAHAKKLCPELLILPPDMPRYRQAAQAIRAIFHDYTELVEPLSLDEAYLDVSGSTRCEGSATLMARELRARVHEQVGITVSAGVAPNKFLAKIASEWRKPDGLFVIRPEQVDVFVSALPVTRLHGVGQVTARRLQQLGIHSCADLREVEPLQLVRWFGKFGQRLGELARGIDERPVEPSQERKSLSVERTYDRDLPDFASCREALPRLIDQLRERLPDTALAAVSKLFVKVKFDNFRQTTVECVGAGLEPAVFFQLCEAAYQRGARPVRLLGVGVRFEAGAELQLELFRR
jgi:DNA polymerase-4